jgi:hypothetical protein
MGTIMRALRRISVLSTAVLLTALAACDSGEGGPADSQGTSCAGGKCDDGDQGLRDQLAQLDDPIAQWLSQNIEADGTIELDYLSMLKDISVQQECDESQIDSYIIADALVSEETFPRVVNTVCSTDRQKADLAFFALSFANEAGDDLDSHQVEMFAWDDTERRYRFYKLNPVDEATSELDIEPEECTQCHLTPRNLDNYKMPMTPIMNELSAPWEHWHAEPVTVNHSVPQWLDEAPVYAELAGPSSKFRKSASRLEQTIRSAYNQRVGVARTRIRRDKPANVEDSMSALRPLFCDEQLTWATEDGASGLLDAGTVIDNGWHTVFFVTQGTGWPWEWWNDRKLRLPSTGGEDTVHMIAMRGESTIAYEKQFLNLRGLKPDQLARIRAIDWHNPVMSDARCGLWEAALPHVIDNPPIEITDTTRNSKLMQPLVDQILVLRPGEMGIGGDLPDEIPLVSPVEGKFLAVSDGSPDALADLGKILADGTIGDQTCAEEDGAGNCLVTLDEMGDMLEARFKTVEAEGRGFLQREKQLRACKAEDTVGAVPHVDGLSCD